MTQQISHQALASLSGSRDLGAFVGGGAGVHEPARHEDSPFIIFQRMHRLLRGRYAIALSLATVGAIAGAAAGYFIPKPKYLSQGSIHIQPVISPKMYDVRGLNDMPPMFTNFVKTQANLLQEPLVIEGATNSREWVATGRNLEPDARDRFMNSLVVTTPHDEQEWIRVNFIDRDPKVAKIAVQQVIESYVQRWGSKMGIITPELINEISNQRRVVSGDIDTLRKQIDAIYNSPAVSTSNIDDLQTACTKQLRENQLALDDLTLKVKQAEAAADGGAAATPETPLDPEFANGEIGKVDDEMRTLLGQRMLLEAEVSRLEALGLQQGHPSLRKAIARREGIRTQINEYRDTWLKAHGSLPATPGMLVGPVSKDQLANMKAQQAVLQNQRETLQKRARELTDARSDVERLSGEMKRKQEDFDRFDQRLKEIQFESKDSQSSGSERIQIISKGEEPTKPYSDPRVKLGALGFAMGAGIPIGLVMLIGLVDRRFRYSDDAGTTPGQVALLGILPYLPDNMADPEQAAVAAHCVHQIRTLLQIGGSHQDRKVFTITSPTSGDGKTSLSLSLGLSFAASGSRTLLIDFDLVGGGLTSAMQARSDKGVLDAMLKGQLNGHVVPTAFPRLSIIPAGENEAQEVSRLSPSLVRRLLDRAREEYDVVVVDTGPILGSLEASLVSSESDGVVLALGRGQQRFQVERAVNHLTSVGAKLIGVVFNRAQPGDFRRAVSSASVRSVPVNTNGTGDASRNPALGPMARTVASHIHAEDDDGL